MLPLDYDDGIVCHPWRRKKREMCKMQWWKKNLIKIKIKRMKESGISKKWDNDLAKYRKIKRSEKEEMTERRTKIRKERERER